MPTTFVPFENVQIVLKILTKISPFRFSQVKLENDILYT